jgi:hypothetical protein
MQVDVGRIASPSRKVGKAHHQGLAKREDPKLGIEP